MLTLCTGNCMLLTFRLASLTLSVVLNPLLLSSAASPKVEGDALLYM